MVDTKFCLSWATYQSNICKGLGSLQQNGELVDMTLAADGYHVKVHQLVMSLMSPYIKNLISTANCPHPIIFLNQISIKTLHAILEYVYTGEVLVGKDDLPEVVQAAKALQIQGLSTMDIGTPLLAEKSVNSKLDLMLMDTMESSKVESFNYEKDITPLEEESGPSTESSQTIITPIKQTNEQSNTVDMRKPSVQFSVSNRGNLILILNRFMYHLRYSGKNNNHRRWLCVDHENTTKCNAAVITQGENIIKRLGAHKHGFHDKKILKKVSAASVYSAIVDAERKIPEFCRKKLEV